MNRTFIIGRVVRDAELKKVDVEGLPTSRCRFSVAVNETRANGEKIVTYFEVTAWRNYADKIAKWLTKGRQVHVEGAVRLNKYMDKNGNFRAVMQIHDPTVTFLGDKPEVAAEEEVPTFEELDELEELPFE